MMENLTAKFEFKYYLAHDTEEKALIIAACLIGKENEIIVKCNAIMSAEGEKKNFLTVLEWLCLEKMVYPDTPNKKEIVFFNGSKIVFKEYEMPIDNRFISDYTQPWEAGK